MVPSDAGEPSEWIRRHAGLVPRGGPVLDLAAGRGRHTKLLRALGHRVTAVDRDIARLGDLLPDEGIEAIETDLEDGSPWVLGDRQFAGVIVANYLWRPLLGNLINAVAADGVLIYETFGIGNEAYGRPRNPDFLLRPGELLALCRGRLEIVAYECGTRQAQAVVQRVCAVRSQNPIRRI